MIFVDTNILEENLGDYIIDTVVHNEIIYASTVHYLEHKHGVKGVYSARKRIKKHGYPKEVIETIKELIKRLNIRLVASIYIEEELYKTLTEFRLLPSDAIIALTCKHYGINTIATFDEDFKRVPWLKVIP